MLDFSCAAMNELKVIRSDPCVYAQISGIATGQTLQLAGKYSESLFLRPKKTFWREIIPLLAAFLSVMDLGNADTREV